ncbi:hypothetical protein Indivirus_5_6 [Indivirus ILV1]|uniref:Uncharacterized protein n=1 Tax=Indivirus ILV1 TaxID=1977633 RepID=A0A1V0SDU1_9VIRU|nr:hypothetical protein Indivirus_5_6 [Indivirus ILV1]
MVTDKKLKTLLPLPGSVEDKRKWCNKHKKCHGFNTAGWMKNEINYPMVLAPGSEIYVKEKYAKNHPIPAISNYTFHQGMDSNLGDIYQTAALANNPQELASHCQNIPTCKGFNTNGWIKHTILPAQNWYKWSNNPNQGMWINNNRLTK